MSGKGNSGGSNNSGSKNSSSSSSNSGNSSQTSTETRYMIGQYLATPGGWKGVNGD